MNRRKVLAASGAALLAAPAFAAQVLQDRIAEWIAINALGGIEDSNFPATGAATISPRMLADVAHWDALIHAHPRNLLKVLTIADIARAKSGDW